MVQVLTHLGTNAQDAMPGGGRLRVEGANEELGEWGVRDRAEAREGSYVRLSVQDTGQGMSAEMVDKIFDPFYTTKPLGGGAGLGLAMVHGIVKQHHGWVECRSRPGEGTRFDLYLPRHCDEDG